MNREIHRFSILTCPECAHAQAERVPAGEGSVLYQCSACRVLLRPKQGDCCVLCSYGDVPCGAFALVSEELPA
ncbi:MAG: GDCCVxC domain-containing (seleno)protein [Betaproteobacteria bacterium]